MNFAVSVKSTRAGFGRFSKQIARVIVERRSTIEREGQFGKFVQPTKVLIPTKELLSLWSPFTGHFHSKKEIYNLIDVKKTVQPYCDSVIKNTLAWLNEIATVPPWNIQRTKASGINYTKWPLERGFRVNKKPFRNLQEFRAPQIP